MKKNDTLKKHHFWILFGLVPLFVLIAVLVVTSSVGAEINKKLAEIKAAKDSVSSKNPKSQKLIGILEDGQNKVKEKKTSLWEKNWDLQKDLFIWPDSPRLKEIERIGLKFGDPIPDGDGFTRAEFKKPEVYLAEYSNEDTAPGGRATKGIALSVAPTEFRGGWRSILRHVTKNGWRAADPTSEEIWLIMEDLWVQRSLLSAVQSVNQQMAAFNRVKYVRDGITIDDPTPKAALTNPLQRRFESRTWAVELQLKTKDNKQVLTGKLINLTNRLQLMGLNNTMVLNVWLDKGKDARPFEFRIGGEFLPGQGAMKEVKVKKRNANGEVEKDKDGKDMEEVKLVPANETEVDETSRDNIIPPTFGSVTEIVRVEQKFDTRTVPVRRIEALVLGKTDCRYETAQLVMPRFDAYKPKDDGTTTNTTTSDPGSGGIAMPQPGPGRGLGGAGIGGGGGETETGARGGGGTLDTIVEANKKRYVDVKPQVRRMPVGIVVLVDQSLMQDVLLAFANTPLRFQVTQVEWKRFRGTLGSGGGGSGSAGEDDGGVVGGGMGNFSPELNGMYGSGQAPRPGGLGRPPVPGSGGMPGVPRLGQGPGGTGGPTNPYQPYSPSGGLTVSESQLTSGLVELHIYGVVSLYERYSSEQELADAEKAAKEKEAKDKEAKEKEKEAKDKETTDKDGKDKDGKDKDGKSTTPTDGDPKKGTDPKSKEPMTPDPKGTKMRRRVGVRG